MYTISFEISAFLLSLFCLGYCLTAKRRQYRLPKGLHNIVTSQHFWFLIMLLTNMLSSVSSVTGVGLTKLAVNDTVAFWQYFFHALYFAFHTTLSLAFGLYIMNVTGTALSKRKVLIVLFFIPYIVAELMVFTNSLTGWAFYMDADHIYHRGPLMLLLYGIGAFYVAIGFVVFLRNMRAISLSDRIAVLLFVIVAVSGIAVQAVRSEYLVELFFESLACLIMLMVLEEKAGHIDPTTGLLNRLAFNESNRRYIHTKQRYGLVLVKIMEFDQFTKSFSGRTSDALLMKIASYLTETAKGAEAFYYQKESFAILFKEGKEETLNAFANNVIERFQKEWTLDSISIVLEAIAAIVRVPEDIEGFNELEDLVSLNYTKLRTGSYLVPMSEINEARKAKQYEEYLRIAVAEHRFHVKYQPIWSIKEKATVSAEALLRVDMEELAHVSPEIYIPIAEKIGLIREIGRFVFEETCKFLSDPRMKKTKIRYVELNLSVYQFPYGDLVEQCEEIRSRYGVEAKQINFEITESSGAAERAEVQQTVARLRELGYTFSLDDFGTGYSNFVRMFKSEFENIKIDKSILWDLASEQKEVDVLRNLMLFIKNQGAAIVQEGVETKEQLDLVESCGCDYVQGFYFSPAIAPDEFFEYVAKEGKKTN